MTTIREMSQAQESAHLCSSAARSVDYLDSRNRPEEPCEVRTAFQRDCHRVVHSKAFRRLRGKTQVFLWPRGDHYRTRLTHVMEVSQIARTLARALHLNEDLTEAVALAHDIGHTPFGHAGEDTMMKLHPEGFRHERQSLRVVVHLERSGEGLNLTAPVLDGILKHSKGSGSLLNVPSELLPQTLEGQLVRISDLIAYVHHDLDDALRARVLTKEDMPLFMETVLGNTHSGRLTLMVKDVVNASSANGQRTISMSEPMAAALEAVRNFLYQRVYYNNEVHAEFKKASNLIERLWSYFMSNQEEFYTVHWPGALKDGIVEDDVRDFIAGMTDAFAINLHDQLFTPKRWFVL